MKNLRYFVLTLFVSIFAVACNDSHEVLTETPQTETDLTSKSYKISVDEAKETLNNFFTTMAENEESQVSTRSGDADNVSGKWTRKIKNVEAIKANNDVKTYASDISVDIDTLMYAINFEDNQGFALMAADKRTDPIIAIIDEGAFSMEELQKNPGFVIFMENTMTKETEDIKKYEESKENNEVTTYSLGQWGEATYPKSVHAKLETKWDQNPPYNMLCPKENGKNCAAGCWPVAFAQILSYYRSLINVSWRYNNMYGYATMHWDQIIKDCNSYKHGQLDKDFHPQSTFEVANLITYLGVGMSATYGEDNTNVWNYKAMNWIKNYSRLSVGGLNDFNSDKCQTALGFGNTLILMSGTKSKIVGIPTAGHTWVIDGYVVAVNYYTRKFATLFHCNFGWGGQANGYYIGGAFDTRNGPEMIEDSNEGGTEKSNYKYYVKMCIINGTRVGVL